MASNRGESEGRERRHPRGCCRREGTRMTKKVATALTVLMLAIVAWGLLLERHAVTIVINGQEVTGPLTDAIGAGGLLVALIALLCAATLLVFVVAGIGVLVLGCMILVVLILVGLTFPFLLPVLIPLAILWGFVAFMRNR